MNEQILGVQGAINKALGHLEAQSAALSEDEVELIQQTFERLESLEDEAANLWDDILTLRREMRRWWFNLG